MPRLKPTQNKVAPPPPNCPLRACLQFISGAWTAEIIWYLQKEPRRFKDLQRDIGGVSAKVLTTRLKELEENGIISRSVMPTKPPTVEYALTNFGKKLDPIFETIAEVGKLLIRQRKSTEIDSTSKHRRLG